jgi:hypothetical protein
MKASRSSPGIVLATHVVLVGACTVPGQDPWVAPVEIPAVEPGFEVGAWHVELSEARVGFGPAYFCASAAASPEFCEVAMAQIAEVRELDLLTGSTADLEVEGVTGQMRSAMLDYGIHWPTTQPMPVVAAQAPGGHSAVLGGTATRGAEVLEFRALIDVIPPHRGLRALVGVPATWGEVGAPAALEVEFGVPEWFVAVDFEALLAAPQPAQVQPGDPAHDAVVVGMTTTAPPRFHWIP